MVVTIAAAVGLGIVGVVSLLGPSPSQPNRVSSIRPPMTPPLGTALATVQPSATANAAPTFSPAPVSPVTLALSSIEPQTDGSSVIVGIDVANHRASSLSFAFDPGDDVALRDAGGTSWSLRWAQYSGSPTVAANATSLLVRGLFVGPAARKIAWPLDVVVHHVPGAGTAEWHVNQSDTLPEAATQIAPPTPPSVPAGAISLVASNPIPSTELGGVQVDLAVSNQQPSELLLHFDPNVQVTAADNLGRLYQVRWAQYAGETHVPAHATVHLTRLFLSGPIATGDPAWLAVVVHQVPGGVPLKANVPMV
jgi:hypothetical protein